MLNNNLNNHKIKPKEFNNKTLTILLIARLVGDNSLIDFDLNSLVIIRNALNSIGLKNLSKIITQEIMTSKIVNL